ncbi:MAG: hypothetical protein R2698_08495 [Microthrixaceae bacterium]
MAWVLERVLAEPPDEVALADSIGVAVPTDVVERLRSARSLVVASGAEVTLRCHFHDTRHTAPANIAAALLEGVRCFDSSLGGIGGCPFAPAATGNVATEDVVYLLERMGFHTGIDLDALVAEVPWVERMLGHGVPGALAKAGTWPRPAE